MSARCYRRERRRRRKGVKPGEFLEGSSSLNFPGIERCRDDTDVQTM
jgi:hypothetical protein